VSPDRGTKGHIQVKIGKLAGVVLALSTLTVFAGCSKGDSSDAGVASTTAAPVYDSFEKIGNAIGCLSLANSQPETTDIKDNKYCNLEKPTQESGGVTIYEYADVARRDKSLKAGLVYEQSYLVLSDQWAISGGVSDLRTIKAALGRGDLRTAEPGTPSTEGGGIGPGEEEETLDGDAEVVPFGKSVTYENERVQPGKIYCGGLNGGGDANKQFDSCRFPDYTDQYDDTTKAPKGQEFYLVAFAWKNVGKRPITPTDFGTLVTSEGLEYAAEDEISDDLTSSARGNENFDTSSDQNPGTTGRILLSYAVPKGTKVDKVHWGFDSAFEGPPAYALKVK